MCADFVDQRPHSLNVLRPLRQQLMRVPRRCVHRGETLHQPLPLHPVAKDVGHVAPEILRWLLAAADFLQFGFIKEDLHLVAMLARSEWRHAESFLEV